MDPTPIVTTITTALAGLLVWLVQERRATMKLSQAQTTTVSRALLAVIRQQMVATHRTAVVRWSIDSTELNSFREMHQLYVELGGNGPTSKLIDDLDRVRLVASDTLIELEREKR